jgi:hypothetical protein
MDGVPPPSRIYDDRAPLRPLLLAALATALVSGLIVFIILLSPHPAWRWLTPVAFVAALEGIVTTHWLNHPDRRYLGRGRYRAAELLVIAVFLRLFTWLLSGGLPGPAAWRGYLLSPLSVLDGLFVGYLLVAVLAWERGITWSGLFDKLRLSEAEVAYYSLPARQQTERHADRPIDRSRPEVFASFVGSWLGGGTLLAFATALTSVDVVGLARDGLTAVTRLGLHPQMLVALLVYFLLGLWLVSQARLLMMRTRWTADGVAMTGDMPRTWNRSTLVLVAVVALVAAFLPIGRTFALAALVQLVFDVGLLVMQTVFLLLAGLMIFLLGLFGAAAEELPEPELTMVPGPTPAPVPTPPPSETPALIIGGLFWLLVSFVALVALLFFLRDRGVRLDSVLLRRWWAQLRAWLRAFWRRGAAGAAALVTALGARREAEKATGLEPRRGWRFLRVNALPPREQVRYFYLSTVRRAGEQGVARAPGETPSEYQADLQSTWPEAGVEIEQLTGAFLEARYSRQPIEPRQVNPIREVWKRVRQALRRRRREAGSAAVGHEVVEKEEDAADEHAKEDQR